MDGFARLAGVLNGSVKRRIQGNAVTEIEFGTIQGDLSLIADSLGVPIPKGDYLVSLYLTGDGSTGAASGHSHSLPVSRPLKAGDRVLIAWDGNDPAVVSILVSS